MNARSDKLLILDLDETLVYATPESLERTADIVGSYHIYKRPHLDQFLEVCFNWFEVAIWTTATRAYAAWLIKALVRDPDRLAFVWTHERCSQRYDQEQCTWVEVKPLKKLKRRGYDLRKVLVVDDTPETYQENYGNAIRVRPYAGAAEDDELQLLLLYLEAIGEVDNVRAIEKRGWRAQAERLVRDTESRREAFGATNGVH